MPTLEEIAVVKKMKKPEKNSGQVDVAESQIPVGEELTEGVAAFIKEVEDQPISPDVHSRRILPSDKLTRHSDSHHPLPAREVMIHKDNVAAYTEAAFEKHKLDLKKTREKIDELKKAVEPEEDQALKEEPAGPEIKKAELKKPEVEKAPAVSVPDNTKSRASAPEKAKPVENKLASEDVLARRKRKEEISNLLYPSEAPKPDENYLTPDQAKEIDAIADELRRKKLAEVVSASGLVGNQAEQKIHNDNPDNLPVEELKKLRRFYDEESPASEKKEVDNKKNETFWQKAGSILKNPEIQMQLLKTGISIPASMFGYKSLYDVPAYLIQRYAVRGNIMGLGKGKGLSGSVEELLEASQLHKAIKDNSNENTPGFLMKAIKDLDKRLAKTREGSEKGSEQRGKIAKLLWENRHQEKQTKEARGKELENILDNYTTTKVTGIQAAREALNSACVATGAFALRGVAYGGLAFFEQQEKMRREEKVKALEKGPEAKAEELDVAKVLVQSVRETFDGLRFKTGKNKIQKTSAAIKSFGSIARLVGIAIGVGTGGHVYGASLDKLNDVLENKDKLAAIGHNFVSNAERYEHLLPTIGKTFGNIFNHHEVLADSLSHHGLVHHGASAAIPQNPVHDPAQVKSMTGEEIPEAPFQHGKSVWQEGGKQLLARFGDKFSHLDKAAQEANIARLQNAITADPEAFGLPKDVDFNKMTAADLENLKWSEAVNNVFGDREGLTEAVHNLDKTLAQPNENLVHFGGAVEPVAPDLGDGQAAGAIDYFSGGKMQAHLEELSDKARKFYDPSTSQIEKRHIFAELQEARANIQRATGGTVTFGKDGDINVVLANGEIVNAFGNSHLPETDMAQVETSLAETPAAPMAAGPHHPSLGYNPLDSHHESLNNAHNDSESGQGHLAAVEIHNPDTDYQTPAEHPAVQEASSHSGAETEVLPHVGDPRDIHEPITNAGIAKALLRNAEHPRNIDVHHTGEVSLDLRHVQEISPAALKVWQNKPGTYNFFGLKHINQETYNTLSHFKGKVILNDEAAKQFEAFDKRNAEYADWFKAENLDQAAKPAEAASHVEAVPVEAANHVEAVPVEAASHVEAVPENVAAHGEVLPAAFADQMRHDPFGNMPKVHLSFADKYSDFQRENLSAFVNTEIEERNELIKILGDYEKTYGNRPQFAEFRKLVGERLMAENLTIVKIINGVKDPAQNFEAAVQKIGQGGPRVAAESIAEIFSQQAKLITPDEMADEAFAQLDRKK